MNLETQLLERMKVRDLPSFEDYFHLLEEDLEEFNALIERITTKETYFFRLPDQFTALAKHIMPWIEETLSKEAQRLIVEKGWSGTRSMPIRVWSCGCATGEEPYSIAMTLMESLQYPKAWQVEILATDISKKALTTASTGFYEAHGLKKIPSDYQNKYIQKVNGGAIMMDELREKISFRIFNLRNMIVRKGSSCPFMKLDGTGEHLELFERFDMIFCRNVMIYFDFDAQQQLVDNLYACLRPGGYLFTGDAELLHIYKHAFKTLEIERAYFYQKPENERPTREEKING
jgi:chemotaxis protein methyltransferase CheR